VTAWEGLTVYAIDTVDMLIDIFIANQHNLGKFKKDRQTQAHQ